MAVLLASAVVEVLTTCVPQSRLAAAQIEVLTASPVGAKLAAIQVEVLDRGIGTQNALLASVKVEALVADRVPSFTRLAAIGVEILGDSGAAPADYPAPDAPALPTDYTLPDWWST
jgi:hypothetical protein